MEEPTDSPRRRCFGCGEENPEGLQIDFTIDGKRAIGRFVPRRQHQGFPGLTHGGISAAAIDEAMGWAMYAAGVWAVTAKMEIKYRQAVPVESALVVWAEVVKDRGRRIEAIGELLTPEGELLVEAKGLFMRVPEDKSQQLEAFYLGRRRDGDREIR